MELVWDWDLVGSPLMRTSSTEEEEEEEVEWATWVLEVNKVKPVGLFVFF